MTEKSSYVADHFPCIFVVFTQWHACFQGCALMFAQEYCDNTDFFVLAEEKRMAATYAISQKPHGKPKNGNCRRNGGKSTIMAGVL